MMNRVKINISGENFETYEKTLSRYPETLLGSRQERQRYYDPNTGEYFFNRNRLAFEAILVYYQSYGTLIKPENISEKQFVSELLFFKIGNPEQWLTFTEKVDRMIIGTRMELPKNKILRCLWNLFAVPESSRVALFIAIVNMLILSLSIVLACVRSFPDIDHPKTPDGRRTQKVINILDHLCYIWFTFEFGARLISASDKRSFIKSFLNIADFVAIIPYYLQLIIEHGTQLTPLTMLRTLRIFRILRLMKFSRYSRGMRSLFYTLYASRHELEHFFFITLVATLLSASLAYYAEMNSETSTVENIPIAMWWAINTLTTVGYGDIYPVTTAGKFLGGALSVVGTILLGLPIYCLVSNFSALWASLKETTNEEREINITKEKHNKNKNNNLFDCLRTESPGSSQEITFLFESGDISQIKSPKEVKFKVVPNIIISECKMPLETTI